MRRANLVSLTAPEVHSTSLLEKLPSEVLHHILSNLAPFDLASVRLVSRSILCLATSNTHWRRIVIEDLLPNYVALQDIASLPLRLWAFSLVEDGWFQAFLKLHNVARDPWLQRQEDLYNQVFMIYFKSHLRQGGAEAGLEDYHVLCGFTPDNWAKTLDGLPLENKKYAVVDGEMIVSAYPPNIPGRDPRTWCRTFEHISVLMVSDAPEFLASLIELNSNIMQRAVKSGKIVQTEALERERELGELARAIFDRPGIAMVKILQERHAAQRNRLMARGAGRRGSLDELMREESSRTEGEETGSDSDESLDESLQDREMEYVDNRETTLGDKCASPMY